MTSKVKAKELKELVSKVSAEKSNLLPDLYDRVKTLIEGIDGTQLKFNEFGSTTFTHENISINAKADSSADRKGMLNLELVELQDDITFETRGREVTYPKGMNFLRLYSA